MTARSSLVPSLLRITCLCLFIGRAWQHLVWDAPLRSFFLDESLLGDIAPLLTGMDWASYVTSPNVDGFITGLTRGLGICYAGMALLTAVITPRMQRWRWVYAVASGLLVILAFLYFKEKSYHIPQFFEYAIQFLTPLFFAGWLFERISQERLLLWMKIAIACTFIAHGTYAMGLYPTPGVFVYMTIQILGVSEPAARQFLLVAGIMDVVISIGLFVPNRRVVQACLLYAVAWGLATAIARTWAPVVAEPALWTVWNRSLPQTIYRLPHGLLPLVAWGLLRVQNLQAPLNQPPVQKTVRYS